MGVYLAAMLAVEAEAGIDLSLIETLANATGPFLMAVIIVAFLRRWVVLPRELDACLARIVELSAERDRRVAEALVERDEFKALALRSLDIGERVTSVVEGRAP